MFKIFPGFHLVEEYQKKKKKDVCLMIRLFRKQSKSLPLLAFH